MNPIERIEELRNQRGWSINKLAMEATLTPSTLSSILNRGKSLNIDTLLHICEGFGITTAQFFAEDEESEVVSPQEKLMLAQFRKLPPEKKKALIALLCD
jgi:transcriptional regulator with XRE-family HTH domain